MGDPLGPDKLTGDELANCSDNVCPRPLFAARRKAHEADVLKKLRTGIRREKGRLEPLSQEMSAFVQNFLAAVGAKPAAAAPAGRCGS